MQLHDLAQAYETKSDAELLVLAQDRTALTFEARSVLEAELSRRRLDPRAIAVHEEIRAAAITQQTLKPKGETVSCDRFLACVTRLYRRNFWLFVRLIAPAVVVGYLGIALARSTGRDIADELPRGVEVLQHRFELLEIWIVNLGGIFASWIAFSISFAGICSAVTQLEAGTLPTLRQCFLKLRERPIPFAAVSILLFVLCLLAFGLSFLTMSLLFLFGHPSSLVVLAASYTVLGVGLLALSRFALAIPAVVLGHCTFGQSMFRSDELTEGRWLILLALLSKSVIGGYVAGMLPFWVAGLLWTYIHLPAWLLTTMSFAGVIIVEPFMFIGFSLLYVRMSESVVAQPAQ